MGAATTPSAGTSACAFRGQTPTSGRADVSRGLAPQHADGSRDVMDEPANMASCAESAKEQQRRKCFSPNWEFLPPTRKEPHWSLPPCRLRGHALHERDLSDYRLYRYRRDPPDRGLLGSQKYLFARYSRLIAGQPTGNRLHTRPLPSSFAVLPAGVLRIVTGVEQMPARAQED
jgi:hypothetical protein